MTTNSSHIRLSRCRSKFRTGRSPIAALLNTAKATPQPLSSRIVRSQDPFRPVASALFPRYIVNHPTLNSLPRGPLMNRLSSRRDFLATSAGLAAAATLPSLAPAQGKEPPFKISLAEWSLHKAINGGQLKNRDFARAAKEDYGIDAIEYVNQLWKDNN